MKRISLLLLAALGVACANRPTCHLASGTAPLPPAHPKPFRPKPWTSFDGTKFPYSVWRPAQSVRPKGLVILAPGWDGTMTDYAPLAEHLSRHGYVVYGSEQRAGRYDPSLLRQGNPTDWQSWVKDLQTFAHFAAERHPGLPVFYHGHSFGTIVVLQAAHEERKAGSPYAPRGVILQSLAMPFLIERENPALGALVGTFAGVRFPHLTLIELLNGKPTGDEVLNCRWLHSRDRLGSGYKVRFLEQAAKLGHAARLAATRDPGPPVLALEGRKDNVVAPLPQQKKTYHRFLTRELRGGRAKVICYPSGFHTITIAETKCPVLDAESTKAKRDITRWLDERGR